MCATPTSTRCTCCRRSCWLAGVIMKGQGQGVVMNIVIGIIGIVVTAAYILWKIVQYVFLGEFSMDRWKMVTHGAKLTDMVSFEKITMWPLVAFMIVFSIFPTPIIEFFNDFSQALFGG